MAIEPQTPPAGGMPPAGEGAADEQSSVRSAPYAVGMEVPHPAVSTAPGDLHPAAWEPYYGLRFRRRTRVLLTIAVAVLPALFTFAAAVQVTLGEGRARAACVVLLFPVVPMVPLALWATRDLWGEHH